MTTEQQRATADELRAILATEPEDGFFFWLALYRVLAAPVREG